MNKDIKILISDDSAFMRKILRDILQSNGFSNFVECGNGKECLEKYETEKPDLVLLDIIMPIMNGIEVLKKIGKEAKVMMISAVGQEKMIEEAKQYGALGFIVKPFDSKKVVEKIEEIIK